MYVYVPALLARESLSVLDMIRIAMFPDAEFNQPGALR